MPILHQFEYAKPQSIEEVVQLCSKQTNYAILAGGTDLALLLKEGTVRPDLVIDTKGLDSFKHIAFKENTLLIGAGVTFTDLLDSDIVRQKFPVIIEIAKTVASVGIRNRATVVGNICSAVPCMDSGPLLAAYNASVLTAGIQGARAIPSEEWFLAPRKTGLREGEIVTGVSFPLPTVKHAGCWVKLGRYAGEDLAQVSVLILTLADGSYRISFGAVAPVPVRAKKIEQLLNGQTLTPVLLQKAEKLIEEEINPITDVRASKEYRMHMAKVMFTRGLNAAISRLNGKGPEYGTSVI